MRPISQRNKRRDWRHNEGWHRVKWEDFEGWMYAYSIASYYPKKESRERGNRAVRRYKGEIPNGCAYKKVYDVAWEIW
jgi:hypothetical protein